MSTETLLESYIKEKDEQKKFAICFHAFEWWITQDLGLSKDDSYLKEKVYDGILNEDWDRGEYRIPAINFMYKKKYDNDETFMKDPVGVQGALQEFFEGIVTGGEGFIYVESAKGVIDAGVGDSIINLLIGSLMLQKSGDDAVTESQKVSDAIGVAISNTDKAHKQKTRYNEQLREYEARVKDIAGFGKLNLADIPKVAATPSKPKSTTIQLKELKEDYEELKKTNARLEKTSREDKEDLATAKENNNGLEESVTNFLKGFIEEGKADRKITAKTIARLATIHLVGNKDIIRAINKIKV